MSEEEEKRKKILSLKKQQKNAMRTNVQKEIKKAQNVAAAESLDENAASVSMQKLRTYRQDLKDLDEIILPSLDDSEMEKQVLSSSSVDDSILDVVSLLQARLDGSRSQQVAKQPMSSSTYVKSSVKLPKLEVVRFDGDALKWEEFWDSFNTTIHGNQDLKPVEKLQYLRSLLDPPAKRLAESYALTEANYEVVRDVLKQKYGDKQLSTYTHLDAMLTMPVSSGDLEDLQRVFDDCEKHVRSLTSLGMPEDTFGQVFAMVILSKLPPGVRVELHRQNGMKAWTLSNLRQLLRDELHARSMSARVFGKQPESKKDGKKSCQQQGKDPVKSPPATASSLVSDSKCKREKNNAKAKQPCVFCGKAHYHDQCTEFPDLVSRKAQVKGKCFSCLREGHSISDCKSKRKCFFCSSFGTHHRCLCPKKFKNPTKTDLTLNTEGLNAYAQVFVPQAGKQETSMLAVGEKAILQTALAIAFGDSGQSQIRLLLDPASTRSFVRSDVCESIGAKYNGEDVISIAGFESKKRKTSKYKAYDIKLKLPNNCVMVITANATENISCPVQRYPINRSRHPILKSIPLADPPVSEPTAVQIDLLVGADHYYDIVGAEQIRCANGLVLLQTPLGYVAAGKLASSNSNSTESTVLFLGAEDSVLNPQYDLERFWRLEDIGVKEGSNETEDDIAVQKFNETVRFNKDTQRYEVTWPWKDNHPNLPSNFGIALGRLKSLLKKTSEDTLSLYHHTIETQLQLGITEIAPDQPDGSIVHYVPHHSVVRPDRTTTKLRVVYDASCKAGSNVPCLNDCILRGPVILADLCGLLIRFRLHPIGICSDVEKAFLQVGLQKSERDALRFLWVTDPKMPPRDSNLVCYRFCRVPFGVVASPFLLGATIRHHLQQQDSPLAEKMIADSYVDNLVSGTPSSDEAVRYYTEAKRLFQAISMNLTEWYTNDPVLRARLPAQDVGKSGSAFVLGLSWDLTNDTLACSAGKRTNVTQVRASKRSVLQEVARLYDPLGLFNPVSVVGKLIVQELWRRNMSWDDPIPEDMLGDWIKFHADLIQIPSFRLPRCIDPSIFEVSATIEIHCFCDASKKAYCAALYLRVSVDGRVSSSLIFSKSRVAPVRSETIPKLELLSVTIGSRLIRFVRDQLHVHVNREILWTDSNCVLHWVHGKPVTTIFVRNRVREIKDRKIGSIRYVPTESNPADVPTRGMSLDALKQCTLWWNGPPWLTQDESQWPADLVQMTTTQLTEIEEPKMEPDMSLPVPQAEIKPYTVDPERYAHLAKLLRVVAFVQRFVGNASKRRIRCGNLKAGEIHDALVLVVRESQRRSFPDVLSGAKSARSFVRQLGLFVDTVGIIRCSGRLDNAADLPFEARFPILLPQDDHLTGHVIADCHRRLFHAGVKHTLSELQTQYWIIHGRMQVKKVINKCKHCQRQRCRAFRIPDPPPLPDFRVTRQEPFASTGLDYLGPLYIIHPLQQTPIKVWICLFTCATSRAIHLEVVNDLSSDQFMLGLRRFMALYGKPRLLLCDNAKQFHTAERAFAKMFRDAMEKDRFQSTVQPIQWKFIVELAPWMGGFYERMVALVKQAMKRTLGNARLSYEELFTVCYEIASVLNTRPLTYCEDEVGDVPLCPADLLARQHDLMPSLDVSRDDDDFVPIPLAQRELVANWRRIQARLDQFWSIWRKQYLTSLREHVWKPGTRNTNPAEPRVGTVVLVGDDLPRGRWRLGRIIELHLSSDQVCRSAKVILGGKDKTILNRPVRQLYPLEFSEEPCDNGSENSRIAGTVQDMGGKGRRPGKPPQRAAAKQAQSRWKHQLDTGDSDNE